MRALEGMLSFRWGGGLSCCILHGCCRRHTLHGLQSMQVQLCSAISLETVADAPRALGTKASLL